MLIYSNTFGPLNVPPHYWIVTDPPHAACGPDVSTCVAQEIQMHGTRYRFRLLSGDGTHVARGCLWAAERAGELPMNPTAAMGPLIEYGITHGARRIVYPARREWDYTI